MTRGSAPDADSPPAGRQLLPPSRVIRPDGPDGVLVPQPVRDRRARPVGEIPPPTVELRSDRPAPRHLKEPVRVRLPDPVPGVPQPLRPILLWLVCEPTDLVVPPHPDAPGPG